GAGGVLIEDGATGNTVGGSGPNTRNFISGNKGHGVSVFADGNVVAGNVIGQGTDSSAQGNTGAGVFISGVGNTVGGTGPNAGNVLANNNQGVAVLSPNSTGNSILGNSIFASAQLGIDIGFDGFTPNADAPRGLANNGQNYPILFNAEDNLTSTTVRGMLHGRPAATYRIEFFASPGPLPASDPEGQIFLGHTSVTTDAAANAHSTAAVQFVPGFNVSGARTVTATATNLATGDTSEFSPPAGFSLENVTLPDQEALVNAPFKYPLGVRVTDSHLDGVL